MNLKEFQDINAERGHRWLGGNLSNWSLLEWTGAMCGEAGEAANFAKKIKRLDSDLPNLKAGISETNRMALKHKCAREVADTIIYGLLILTELGFNAEEVIAEVFDTKSIEYGFPERAPE